jgi:hypothetical protein
MDTTAISIFDPALFGESQIYSQVHSFIKIWIGLVILIILALLVRYTLGVGFNKENPNPYAKETFAMPRGVFRGILTLSLLFVVLLLEMLSLNGKVIPVGEKIFVPEDMYGKLMVAFQMMIAFYFGGKVLHHVTSADRDKTKEIAKAAIASGQEARDEFEKPGAQG